MIVILNISNEILQSYIRLNTLICSFVIEKYGDPVSIALFKISNFDYQSEILHSE